MQLSVEREELMRALRIESSNCSKLKVLFLSDPTVTMLDKVSHCTSIIIVVVIK